MPQPLTTTSLPRAVVMMSNNLHPLFDPPFTNILGSSPLQILPLKYGIKNLTKSKEPAPLQFLKVKLNNVLHVCPCRQVG